jgi:hypothetical protein
MISSLLVNVGKKRSTLMQIKNSDFFKKYIENWSDVEKGKL